MRSMSKRDRRFKTVVFAIYGEIEPYLLGVEVETLCSVFTGWYACGMCSVKAIAYDWHTESKV